MPHPIDPVAPGPSAPDITVCLLMTLHNRARFVPAAIRSVLTQTVSTFHLIVVDDGSSDEAPDLAQRLAAEDAARLGHSRVTLMRSPRIGRFAALAVAHDAAARLAPSALLGWVDSDDLLVDTALAETTAFLQNHPSCGMVYTQHIIIDDANRPLGLGPRCLVPYSPQALLLDFLTHHFRLFRPSLYRDIGGVDSSFTSAGDYDFCLKASERTTILHLPRPLYCYRVHPDSISLARHDEQRANAVRAIEAALVRRGLADRLRLVVTPDRRFQLVDR